MQTETGSEKGLIARWFTEPPYFGVLLVLAFFLGIGLAALTQRPQPSAPQVVQATPPPPPVSVTPGPSPQASPAPEEPTPQVSVRAVPGTPPEKKPEADKPGDENAPASEVPSGAAGSKAPKIAVRTAPAPAPDQPGQDATPVPEPPVPSPEPVPVPAQPDFRPMEPPARPRPQPQPQRAEPPARPRPSFRPPARDTGDVSVFFDADSSTFDRRGNRLPLRVEVYVDGRKRLESDDPEKRSFNLGRLEEGEHEIEIVPYVGNLPSASRREVIRVSPGERARFKAVLRREDGASRIGKFRPRD
jgi:hypothetical protein